MRRSRGLALLALVVAACGGDSTAPGASTPVAFLTLSLDRDTLLVRESLDATVRLSDASHAVLTDRPITWSSSDSSVLSITRGGGITALRAGTATVTASSGDASASREIAVRSLHFVDVALSGTFSCGLEATGELWCWGRIPAAGFGNGSSKDGLSTVPRRSAIGHRFSAIAAADDNNGSRFACGIESGAVLCWGDNAGGQLGDGTLTPHFSPMPVPGLPPATAVTTSAVYGGAFACALVIGGQVQCWGSNYDGQLGDGTLADRATPAPVLGISGATAISAGRAQACALVNASVSCWGSDFNGELGHDTTYDRLSPVRAGLGPGVPPTWSAATASEWHGCALTPAGAAWCWGLYKTLTDGYYTSYDALAYWPEAQAVGHQFVRLADGARTQCGLEAGGDAWCWVFSRAPIRFPSTVPFTDVVTSWRSACALDVNGAVRCMNIWSPGAGPVLVSGAPPLVRLAADDSSVCGLTAGGAVWCWGGGDSAPVSSAALKSGATTFSSIWSGTDGVCAITPAGDAWCLTSYYYPSDQLLVAEAVGYSLAAVARGLRVTCGITTAGAALCWDPRNSNANGQMGDGTRIGHTTPAPVVGGITFTSITVGYDHACGMTAAGALYCWGMGIWGTMGDGTGPFSRSPVVVSGNHAFSALASGAGLVSCGLDAGGVAICWPRTTKAVAGLQLMAVAAAGEYGCGLDLSGAPSCWTAEGTGWRVAPVQSGARFATIKAGASTACGITQTGSTWCWGTNRYGNLGSPDAAGLASSSVAVPVYGSE
jgi:alpha-tubulin suppressor-like RCC1 family protein